MFLSCLRDSPYVTSGNWARSESDKANSGNAKSNPRNRSRTKTSGLHYYRDHNRPDRDRLRGFHLGDGRARGIARGSPGALPGEALAYGHNAGLGQSRAHAGVLRRMGVPVQPPQREQPRLAIRHPSAQRGPGPTRDLRIVVQDRADSASHNRQADHGNYPSASTWNAPSDHGVLEIPRRNALSRGTYMGTRLKGLLI